mmetsp:Transcript_48592/g.96924  ORF Transcript_48592/g.96924 Transcript_48592/m.96924 type:complete len:208 (-) Transcript_48592:1266-1889(-)
MPTRDKTVGALAIIGAILTRAIGGNMPTAVATPSSKMFCTSCCRLSEREQPAWPPSSSATAACAASAAATRSCTRASSCSSTRRSMVASTSCRPCRNCADMRTACSLVCLASVVRASREVTSVRTWGSSHEAASLSPSVDEPKRGASRANSASAAAVALLRASSSDSAPKMAALDTRATTSSTCSASLPGSAMPSSVSAAGIHRCSV